MALNDVYRASAVFSNTNADGDVVITHHYQLTTISASMTETEYADQVATKLATEYEDHYMTDVSANWTLERCDVFNVTQPQYQATHASGVAGTLVGATVPLRSSPVLSKKTGLRGRSRNGRMFMLSPREADTDNGLLTGSYQTFLEDFGTNQLKTLTLGNLNVYSHVIWSEKLLIATLVTEYIARGTMGSQRGRQAVGS